VVFATVSPSILKVVSVLALLLPSKVVIMGMSFSSSFLASPFLYSRCGSFRSFLMLFSSSLIFCGGWFSQSLGSSPR